MLSVNVVGELAHHFHGIVLALFLIHIVALQVEMCEIQGDAILRRCDNFPDTILVPWIGLGERRTCDGAVAVVEESTARICRDVGSFMLSFFFFSFISSGYD